MSSQDHYSDNLKERQQLKGRMKATKKLLREEFEGLMDDSCFDLLLGLAVSELISRLSTMQRKLNATYIAADERDLLSRSEKRTKRHGLRKKD